MALAALALFPIAAAQGQTLPPKYSVIKLPTFPLSKSMLEDDTVKAMSSDGSNIVGFATQYAASGKTSAYKAFFWDGTMHELGVVASTPGTTPLSVTSGLNPTVLLGYSPPSVWTLPGNRVFLPSLGGLSCAAYAMNDAATVVGFAYNPNVPLGLGSDGSSLYAQIGMRWSKGATGWQYTQLPPLSLSGHNHSRSGFGQNSIDQAGNMYGISAVAGPDPTSNGPTLSDVHAVYWDTALVPHDLGVLPQLNNHSGTLPADWRMDANFQTRFIWNLGSQAFYSFPNTSVTTELFGTGASSPSAAVKGLNAAGQVTGIANFAGGSHAFYWDTTFPTGAVMDLGVLSGTNTGSAVEQTGYFNIIDDNGFIVGSSFDFTSIAFLSTPASRATSQKLIDLNTLLTPNALKNAGITALTGARIINNAGYITCVGTDVNGGNHPLRVVRLKREQ